MGLPTSGPLSLSDIAAEVGADVSYSLKGMSDASGLGSPYTINNFYGYSSKPILMMFYITDASFKDPSEMCGGLSGNLAWHSGSGKLPAIGEEAYSDENGTAVLSDAFYGVSDTENGNALQTISVAKGVIDDILDCK